MIRPFMVFGCVLCVAPAIASAAISLQIGPNRGTGPGNADLTWVLPSPGEQFFDLIFQGDTIEGLPADEALFAYDLLLTASPGLNLVRVEKPDNWVFGRPDAVFAQAEADPRHILVNAINSLDPTAPPGSDITTGKKAARVFFTIDPTTCYPLYTVTLDPNVTVFGSGDPNQEPSLPIDISDPGTVLGCPEPSGLAGLFVGGLLALRRRRTPRALE